VQHLGEWQVIPIQEVKPIPKSPSTLPTSSGIYALYDSSASLIYLGQALNLREEIRQTPHRKANFHVRRGPQLSVKARPKYRDLVAFLSVYEVSSARLRHNLEALLLRVFPNQSHNNKLGKFL
jgi:excinuclease UvrABC nuclease subunit